MGGLSLYRAARSNLLMVRLSSMSVVKLLIILVREASSKILDLATYLVVRWRSHCTSALNWELPLLCYSTLQGTSSLIFMPKIKKKKCEQTLLFSNIRHWRSKVGEDSSFGGQRWVRIAPLSPPPHHSSSATWDLQSSISFE